MLAEIRPFPLQDTLGPWLGGLPGEVAEEVGHERGHLGPPQGIDRRALPGLVLELLGGAIGHEPFHDRLVDEGEESLGVADQERAAPMR